MVIDWCIICMCINNNYNVIVTNIIYLKHNFKILIDTRQAYYV